MQLPSGARAEPLTRFEWCATDSGMRIALGDLVSRQELEVGIRVDVPALPAGEAVNIRVALSDRDGVLASPPQDVAWTAAAEAEVAAAPRDRVVDRAVASFYAARARHEAVALNRAGEFPRARQVLLRAAADIAANAGDDPGLAAIVFRLRAEAERFGEEMDPMARKAAHFAAYSVAHSRAADGKAKRKAALRISNRLASAMKTSETDPIRVDFLAPADVGLPGRIGLTFAPGKKDRFRPWDRDLDADLQRLREHYKVDRLVSLMQAHEYEMLQIANLVERARAHGIAVRRFPIVDVSAPPARAMARFIRMIEAIVDDVRAGRTVVIHCRGGVGRTGLVAASCLVALGHEPGEAIRRVRSARPGAVEVEPQERWVLRGCRGAQRQAVAAPPARPAPRRANDPC